MNVLGCCSDIISLPNQEAISKVMGFTSLSAICGYGGAFFFTNVNPVVSASYFATVAVTSQVVYHLLERLKDPVETPAKQSESKEGSEKLKCPEIPVKNHFLEAMQLLQIPLFFHLCHGVIGTRLHGAIKLELIVATAHFVAIPVFFHLAIKTWNDPAFENVAATAGVMLTLANGLLRYTSIYR